VKVDEKFSTFPQGLFTNQAVNTSIFTTSEKQPPLVTGVPDAVEAQKTLELQKLRQAKWHGGRIFSRTGFNEQVFEGAENCETLEIPPGFK